MKTVGKQLQDAREAKGWSPEMAARETKIKVGRLHDLEVDDYSNFSSPTYARGFVRTYARSLGLDEYRILRQLDNKLPEDDNASFANDTGIPYMPEASQVSKPFEIGRGVYVAGGVGLAVLLLIGFILLQSYRAGYFAAATPAPAALPVTDTNALPTVADSGTKRAMPADGSAPPAAVAAETPAATAAPAASPVDTNAAPPRAMPVDLGTVPGGTNAAPVAAPTPAPVPATTATPAATASEAPSTNAPVVTASATPESTATVPTNTSTPPRAMPVDLTALNAPDTATNATASIPEISAPAQPAPAPVHHSLSARESNSATPDVRHAAADQATQALIASTAPPAAQPAPEAESMAPNPPVPTASASSPVTPETPALPETSAPAAAPAAAPLATTPPPTASLAQDNHFHGKHLVLTASHDSFIRVVALDGPNAGQVRYASILHGGQSISFNDRKYSINVADASAVDIALDGVNYGPHGDTATPQTFTVESHTP